MLNIDKLFKAAKAAGIDVFEARIGTQSKLSVAVFDSELENYTVADDGTFKVRGLVGGKCGVFTSDRADDEVIDMAIASLKESAEYGNPVDPEFFVDGSKYKYDKVDTFRAGLAQVPAERFIATAKNIAASALAADKRIEHVNVTLEYSDMTQRLINSKGLDVTGRANFALIFAEVKATDGKEVQSGSHYKIISDLDAFDAEGFVKTLADDAIKQFGGGTVDTGKYDVVYSPDCTATLVQALCAGFSAFDAEQHMSLLEGKMGEQVFSPLFCVEQTPIGGDVFCSAFDDEGVPCKNMPLIDKGVPTGYVYDLETAKRAGVESTGNGKLVGGNIRPSIGYITVKNGNMTQAEVFAAVRDGLYITELNGVHSGLDGQSGNYSLQASGFVIKNGKLDRPASLITVAGNIMTDFANVKAVGNDEKLTYFAVKAPSVAIGGISVSGVKQEA